MNIMNALTLRYLKLNKKRTIVTIIGVIISVSMLTAVPTFVTSFLAMMQRITVKDTGNWHVKYIGVTEDQVSKVANDKNTRSVSLSRDIGYAILEGSKNEDKPYLFIKSLDQKAFEAFNIELLEGRLPQSSNEIVLSNLVSENARVEYKLGDTIQLGIGERTLTENGKTIVLDQSYSYRKASEYGEGERFTPRTTGEYTVVGFVSRPVFEPYWAPGYIAVTLLEPGNLTFQDKVDASVEWVKINKAANKHANELAASLGIPGDNIKYNTELLRCYGIMGDDFLSMLMTLAAIFTVLIVVGSVSLIYNSFAISISERSRHLGMLASIGATKTQKSRSVFFEAFFVGSIGIPLGIFFGTIGMGITFVFVEPLLSAIGNGESVLQLKLVTSPVTILIAMLVSIFTILISAWVPAKRASRISPVDAIRQSMDIKLTGKKVKTSRLTRLIFGFEAELGLKNLKRNSRRYKATVFSLGISIVLFLSVSSFSHLTGKSAEVVASDIPYDIMVNVTSSETEEEKQEFYKAVAKLEHVDEAVIERTIYAAISKPGALISDDFNKIIEKYYPDQDIDNYGIQVQLVAIDDAALKRYADKLGIDADALKNPQNPKGILFNTITLRAGKQYNRIDQFRIEPGQKINMELEVAPSSAPVNAEVEVAALAYETPLGQTTQDNPLLTMLFVSEDVFAQIRSQLSDKYDNTALQLAIKSPQPAKLKDSILEYQKQTSVASVYVYDVAEQRSQVDRLYKFMYVFLYGFVTLIAAICVTNIFNTISTSVSLRKREFAMLKSVGMTPDGFNKMINYESLFYGIKALLYGLPISFGVIYLIFRSLVGTFGISYAIPWDSVIICIVAVFALVGSTMLYAGSKIKKENIIDALKNENI